MLQATRSTRPGTWAAVLAIGVAAGAVMWQILACAPDSPMSFSRSGDLAFTVMDPYPAGSKAMAGKVTYRLMVLGKDRQLRELERSSDHMLVAAGYGPDGRRLAYLRLALPSQEDLERVKAFSERLKSEDPKVRAQASQEKWIFAAPPGKVNRAPKPLHEAWVGSALPPGPTLKAFLPDSGALWPAELVLRDVATKAVVATIPFDLPFDLSSDGPDLDGPYSYAALQALPDGERVYLYWFPFSLIAHVPDGALRLLAMATLPGNASPDGRTVATVDDDNAIVQLASSDGARSVHVRLDRKNVASGGLAWAGPDTVAVLSNDVPGEFAIDFVSRDGQRLRSLNVVLRGEKIQQVAELAFSPDGRFMIIGTEGRVHFLSADGRILGRWESPRDAREVLARATFSPDSKQVAFRLLVKDRGGGTAAIVFFTPQGRELLRVAVPPAAPPAASAAAAAKAASAASR
jgi:hypothetical protein